MDLLLLVEVEVSERSCAPVQLGTFGIGLLAIAEVLGKPFFLTLTGSSYKADHEAVLRGGKMSVWGKECWKGQTRTREANK